MAWDIQLESATGDLVFSPARDYAGVSGEQILRQRISMRCKIPKGTYIYDTDGNLGSNLYLIPRSPSPAQIQEAQAAVEDALVPMADEINIIDIEVARTSPTANTLQVNVIFQPVLTDADVPTIDTTSAPDVDAINVTIAQD